jgi:hypothetical protein
LPDALDALRRDIQDAEDQEIFKVLETISRKTISMELMDAVFAIHLRALLGELQKMDFEH